MLIDSESGEPMSITGPGSGQDSGNKAVTKAQTAIKYAYLLSLTISTEDDPENEAVIQEAISRLTKGKTLIVIAHRLSTITDSDQIVVVKDGTIQAKGTHEELLKECSLYHTMWTAHMDAKEVKTA